MPLEIVRNDITKMNIDAIVNVANPQLKMGGGVCGSIFNAAGSQKLFTSINEFIDKHYVKEADTIKLYQTQSVQIGTNYLQSE